MSIFVQIILIMSEQRDGSRKREAKFDMKELNKRQKQQLEEEVERYDHEIIDEENEEFAQAAKQKRNIHRKSKKYKDLEGESDIDEEFKLDVGGAGNKHGVKRKKKYMFNDAGMAMEPFNLENDIKEGILTREGVFKMEREKKYEDEELQDAWFESVKPEQDKMLYEKAQKQQDSEASESEDDMGSDKEEELEEVADQRNDEEKRRDENEKVKLIGEMLEILEKGENASMALKRLRGQQGVVIKKKNVRKAVKEDVKMEEVKENKKEFEKLVALTTRLQDLGYSEVFSELKEDMEYEQKQGELKREREKQRRVREERGWYYKVMNKESGVESEAYGPFTQEEMMEWQGAKYFEESDKQFCTFSKAVDYRNKQDKWFFIDEIVTFSYD